MQSFCLVSKKTSRHNVLMLLPTSLIHCILSDWVEIVSVIKLDIALAGNAHCHSHLLEILSSDEFFIREVKHTKFSPPKWTLDWLNLRHVKVLALDLHEKCELKQIYLFLRAFGKHVKSACPNNDLNRPSKDRYLPTQSYLFAQYCRNLTSYTHDGSFPIRDDCILRTLRNNVQLESLDMYGGMWGDNYFDSDDPEFSSPNLRQLKYGDKYGLERTLHALVRTAPNLQQLSIYCNPGKCTVIESDLILDVAQACPQLRTFCSKELHIGSNDSALKPFLATCTNIVNLNLRKHHDLTDNILIEALTELKSLFSLDLRGCYRLTDRTLAFLAQRFSTTLKGLHLDHSVCLDYTVENGIVLTTEVAMEGFTAAGIASLRAHCTLLYTYHYNIHAGTVALPQHLNAYRIATIVQLSAEYKDTLPMILEHCQQMRILAMPLGRYCGKRAWLSVAELMNVLAHCPHLRMIVGERKRKDFKDEVDYCAVRKAYPKLVFTDNMDVTNFDVFDMPV